MRSEYYTLVWPHSGSSDQQLNFWQNTFFLFVSKNIHITILPNLRHDRQSHVYSHPRSAAQSTHTHPCHSIEKKKCFPDTSRNTNTGTVGHIKLKTRQECSGVTTNKVDSAEKTKLSSLTMCALGIITFATFKRQSRCINISIYFTVLYILQWNLSLLTYQQWTFHMWVNWPFHCYVFQINRLT